METKKRRLAATRIAWVCALIYFTSYVLRKNLGVMLVKVCSDMGVADSALAIVLTGLTITYGSGQLISGVLGDKISPVYMITGGLGVSALVNVGVFFANSVPMMTVLWCINGFAHSMIWAPMVKLFSIYLGDSEYNYAMMRVMWGSAAATIFLRLFCPAMLLVVNWRTIMLITAVYGAVIALGFFLTRKVVFAEPVVRAPEAQKTNEKPETIPLPAYAFAPIVLIIVSIVMHGMLKEGVDVWMPSFLCEVFGMPEENAIFSTVILSVISLVSFTVFGWVYRRFLRNELSCSLFCFILATGAALLLFLSVKLGAPAFISMILMALIMACMTGVNLMLVATVPKRFVKSGKVSTFTGLLDAAAYLGAAIATYGFAALFEGAGWNATLLVWALIAAAGLGICLVCVPLWKKFRKEYADI